MRRSVSQMTLMAAIVATMLYWPLGLIVVVLFSLLGFSPDTFITFDGHLNRYVGLVAWWLVAFAAALIYAALAFPWAQTHGFDARVGRDD